jgi:hypothetical protein
MCHVDLGRSYLRKLGKPTNNVRNNAPELQA